MPKKNFYEILGVSHQATEAEIIATYLKLRRELIASNSPVEEFQKIYEAVLVLTQIRETYDLADEQEDFHTVVPGKTLDEFLNEDDTKTAAEIQAAKIQNENLEKYRKKKEQLRQFSSESNN
ncbi:2647_t:CDS:1 [Cetraspora pellucida]|uniref:2647_t:CDS:1 n=1 Tax=Cetraspora pellucida TaxID=1433469 RepID=A0A9N9A2R4_9GLOM|nr:2647_t:CDS:1 [Cetraspora pellucida]